MTTTATCPKCGEVFEIEVAMSATRVKDKYGFVENTKGAFIAALIKDTPLTKDQIMSACFERFGDFSAGRTVMVLGELRKRGFLKQDGNTYWVEIEAPVVAEEKPVAKKKEKKAA